MEHERDLVLRARQGDADAFERLLEMHGPRMGAVARAIMGGARASEDPLQDAFLRAWRSMRELRDPDRFPAWLRRLVVNCCLNQRRTTARYGRAVGALGSGARAEPGPEQGVIARDEIERALARVSPAHRAILVLRYGADLSGAEIAQTLGIPAGTVRRRIHSALSAVRASVAEDLDPMPGTARGDLRA